MLDRELKKGSAELLILSLVEDQPRHGYDIGHLIEQRSQGVLRFKGQRRRRYYRLTPEGKKVLAAQRSSWRAFVEAVNRITGIEHA
jgi:PadR family transcriptional regulator, regulatory protein PadR